MGDRGNIVIQYDGDPKNRIYLYTHWNGSEIMETLQAALKKNLRWNDDAYLARIIFCELIKDADSEETGFGISPTEIDNNHPLLVVDVEKQVVFEELPGGDRGRSWSFTDYSNLDLKNLK